jgi:hypothetical protein
VVVWGAKSVGGAPVRVIVAGVGQRTAYDGAGGRKGAEGLSGGHSITSK